MFTRSVVTSIATVASLLVATPALAGADLSVQVPAPSPAYVYDTTTFDVTVANIGNKSASNVTLTIQLPETNTSPQVYVLGTLGAIDPRCTQSGTTLNCNLGSIARNTNKVVSLDIELPQADEALAITATAATTSLENSTTNNAATTEAVLLNYAVAVAPGDTAHNRHCTGQGLSSFFECLLFPSSLMSHDIEFLADGELAIVGEPDYSGSWSQPTADSLTLTYIDWTNTVVAEFVGYGTNPGCFEGITTFPDSEYMSVYEVCI
jgi:uncharacterized repeat protein (TIGR01451 family)